MVLNQSVRMSRSPLSFICFLVHHSDWTLSLLSLISRFGLVSSLKQLMVLAAAGMREVCQPSASLIFIGTQNERESKMFDNVNKWSNEMSL